ncbi:MAG: hypothetical protein IJ337_03740, partial [Clostridia bacterium]|nr:hypothetical protein [Clostridia bacterium]
MKKVSSETTVMRNRRSLIVCAVMLALAIVLLSLPFYHFDATLYTKRSGNTFVGDEKYVAVKAEVEAAAEEFRAQGHEGVEIRETVTERVNSKGVTTSMVAFTVGSSQSYNGWDFVGAGLPGSRILIAVIVCLAAAAVLAILGSVG